MTETTGSTFAPSPRLERPDGGLAGVCAALARTTGTDLVLWRVLFVVTTLFGGLGVVLYLAGVLFIPKEGEAQSVGERLVHGPDRHLPGKYLLVVVLLAIGIAGLAADANGVLAAGVIAVLGFMWLRSRDGAVAAPAVAPVGTPVVAYQPPRVVRRSPFVGVTASLALVAAGVLALVGTSVSVPAEVVLASALAVVGLGLVVGSFFGRSSGLVLLAGLLAVALAGTVGARPAIDAGVGDRTWTPTGSASYRLGVGDATLDLRQMPLREAETFRVDARVDVGHLLVLVPEAARLDIDARAQLGDVVLFGAEDNGRRASRSFTDPGRPQIALDASVRTGQVEVRRD
jgi:phage shock protein PspC (stress-responsive transcriptional regulator)